MRCIVVGVVRDNVDCRFVDTIDINATCGEIEAINNLTLPVLKSSRTRFRLTGGCRRA